MGGDITHLGPETTSPGSRVKAAPFCVGSVEC